MLFYQPVKLSDREWVEPIFRSSGFMGSEYTFSNLYNWSKAYTFALAKFDGFVVVKNGKDDAAYLYPAGSGDFRAVIEAMKEDAASLGKPLRLTGVTGEKKAALEREFPDRFRFTPVRDNYDYLYRVDRLTTLAGKKLHGKRNHINRFLENNPDWRYERITPENIGAVSEMSAEWCKINKCSQDGSLKREACAVKSGLEHFFRAGADRRRPLGGRPDRGLFLRIARERVRLRRSGGEGFLRRAGRLSDDQPAVCHKRASEL